LAPALSRRGSLKCRRDEGSEIQAVVPSHSAPSRRRFPIASALIALLSSTSIGLAPVAGHELIAIAGGLRLLGGRSVRQPRSCNHHACGTRADQEFLPCKSYLLAALLAAFHGFTSAHPPQRLVSVASACVTYPLRLRSIYAGLCRRETSVMDLDQGRAGQMSAKGHWPTFSEPIDHGRFMPLSGHCPLLF
jgi:hypothetical protein